MPNIVKKCTIVHFLIQLFVHIFYTINQLTVKYEYIKKYLKTLIRESKVFWGQSKNEIKFGGCCFQPVKLGANFGGLK